MGNNGAVYENVIVPFDGTGTGRTALAPAADLAWRCGARIVIVNNTDASDKASREAIKGKAMTLSGADVDFWVDLDHSLGVALVEAAKFRGRPILCISVKGKQGVNGIHIMAVGWEEIVPRIVTEAGLLPPERRSDKAAF